MDPEEVPVLPQRIERIINRPLETIDLKIIFRDAGSWWLYFALLLYTGLPCNEVAVLTYGNFDRERGVLVRSGRRSRRCREIPITPELMEHIPGDMPLDAPLFPTLYVDIEDRSLREEELNNNLAEPLNYMQALLGAAGRPIASLYSFTLSHNKLLEGHDLFAPDQLAILDHIVRVILRTRRPVILN